MKTTSTRKPNTLAVAELVAQELLTATSPSSGREEASEAAMRACALIREHSLLPFFSPFVADGMKRIRVKSEKPGRCKVCRRQYLFGAELLWTPNCGAIHEGCLSASRTR